MRQDDNPLFGHPDPFPFSVFRAKGIRASDGDSGSLLVEVERDTLKVLDYRLSTIDTYELHTGPAEWRPLGEAARQFADDKVRGRWVRLYSVMDTEKYGRTLMAIEYQTAAGNWLDLADRLRAAGYEKPAKSSSVRAAQLRRAQRIVGRVVALAHVANTASR